MGPGGRKACPGGAWERFLASYKRPSTAKKNYQISIFGSFRRRIGAEFWTRLTSRNTKSPRARSGAKKPAEVGGDTFGRPKNSILGGSEQFGASWGRFLARGRNSLGRIEKCRENEKIDFSTKIEGRCEVRDMGPAGRKTCPSGAWERFLGVRRCLRPLPPVFLAPERARGHFVFRGMRRVQISAPIRLRNDPKIEI